jgi:hypothetical protein
MQQIIIYLNIYLYRILFFSKIRALQNRVTRISSTDQQRSDHIEQVVWVIDKGQQQPGKGQQYPDNSYQVRVEGQRQPDNRNQVTRVTSGRYLEETKGAASNKRPALRWCLRGISKTEALAAEDASKRVGGEEGRSATGSLV